jgi:hypothetical protein
MAKASVSFIDEIVIESARIFQQQRTRQNTKTPRLGNVARDQLWNDQGIVVSDSGQQMRAAAALFEHQGRIKKKRSGFAIYLQKRTNRHN